MTTALATLSSKLAHRFGMAEDAELITTLKQTAFKSREPASDAQLTALLVIANEFGLNPFTKEIYAYPDQHKGIVPVVGVDGWIRIINEHPQFDGMEFDITEDAVTCRMYRKDRTRPTAITEYLAECKRGTDPWKNMPRRMLRHKALMQCARVAFGFAFYDDEEAQAAVGTVIDAATGEVIDRARAPAQAAARPELPAYATADFEKNLPAWSKLVADGKKTASALLAMLQTKATFSEEQKARILVLKPAAEDATPAPAPAAAADNDFAADYDAAEEGAK
ncbi:phage recombination protein Bet [Pseudorhodoferax sp.]|jgi:phage recombination protein Bet|uniref:phage recombination protein Bet n=1 Tax=Pseudorhodoferax sp. TaxID=1993553 RepID=UPI002DD64722|nr:phage recombination protein Bet [Pseudorhodoferax sp.]